MELSSLVRKLDEKNQQLATRNAELVCLKYLFKICVVMCEEPAVNDIPTCNRNLTELQMYEYNNI